MEITNRGEVDAEEVEVEPAEVCQFWLSWPRPITIQRGQMRKVPIVYSLVTDRAVIVVRWVENGEMKSQEFDVD